MAERETPRDVFEALLADWLTAEEMVSGAGPYKPPECLSDEELSQKRAEWLARFDAANGARWGRLPLPEPPR